MHNVNLPIFTIPYNKKMEANKAAHSSASGLVIVINRKWSKSKKTGASAQAFILSANKHNFLVTSSGLTFSIQCKI